MKSIADQLPPEIARQIHPDRRKNEEAYWAVRDQLLNGYGRSLRSLPPTASVSLSGLSFGKPRRNKFDQLETCDRNVMDQLQKLHGLPCQNFRIISGGSLILYLGERLDERSLTEWRLHLEPAWRLDGPTGPLAASLDTCTDDRPPEFVFDSLRALIGKTIKQIAVGSPVLDLRIDFTGAYRLQSFTHWMEVYDGTNWEFRHRSGLRLAMREFTRLVEYSEEPDCLG